MIPIKVQVIDTTRGKRYLLLDDDFRVIDPVRRWLKFLDSCGKSPYTLRSYAYDLLLYFSYLKTIEVTYADISTNAGKGPVDILSGFLLWLQYPSTQYGVLQFGGEAPMRSATSVNRIMTTVLGFYSYLANNHELEELDVYRNIRQNPKFKGFLSEMTRRSTLVHSSIFKQGAPNKDIEGITRDQFYQLRAACYTRRDRVLVSFLFEAGLRLGEALGIKLEDVQEIADQGKISLVSRENKNGARVKRHSDRSVFLPPSLVKETIEYVTEDLTDLGTDYLFVTLNGKNKGQPMTPASVESLFQRLSDRVGFHVHPHMLRHGFAVEKLNSGNWGLADIKAYLGHTSISSTETYAKYSNEKKYEMIRGFLDDHSKVYERYNEPWESEAEE